MAKRITNGQRDFILLLASKDLSDEQIERATGISDTSAFYIIATAAAVENEDGEVIERQRHRIPEATLNWALNKYKKTIPAKPRADEKGNEATFALEKCEMPDFHKELIDMMKANNDLLNELNNQMAGAKKELLAAIDLFCEMVGKKSNELIAANRKRD
jgi:hypothetical protein